MKAWESFYLMDGNNVEIQSQAFVDWGGYRFDWVLTCEGRKAVRASEVVQALGKSEKDTARLLGQNVFPDFRFQSSFGEASRPAWYLYEHGAIQLATSLRTPEAEPFQRWVFDVVVKIFAEGGYIRPSATQQQVDELVAKHKEEKRLLEGECDRLEKQIEGIEGGFVNIDRFISTCLEESDCDGCYFEELYGVYVHFCQKIAKIPCLEWRGFLELLNQRRGKEYLFNLSGEGSPGRALIGGLKILREYKDIGYRAKHLH